MKYLAFTLTLFLLITASTFAQNSQSQQATFQAEIVKMDKNEADIKILKVSPNDFKLASKDFVHVAFRTNIKPATLQPEDIISGTVFYFEAEVNKQAIDSYLISDYKLDNRPILKAQGLKLISCSSVLVLITILIILEKLRQFKKKKSKQASIV